MEAEARNEGETLEKHRKILCALAKKRGYNIGEIYKEVVSGETLTARPEVQRLLRDVEAGKWAGVLVMEIERLARGDTIDQGIVARAFRLSNTLIITPNKTYDPNNEFDEEFFEFSLFMSRREYKTIRRRMQAGKNAAAREGQFMGSIAPYGYKRVRSDNVYTLEPLEDEAEVVKNIFKWYTEGFMQQNGSLKRLGVSLIARKLNELKIKPRRSEVWVTATIRDILLNPVYIGKIRWNWRPAKKHIKDGVQKSTRARSPIDKVELIDGLHTAIISSEIFETAQEYLRSNRPVPVPDKSTIKNPLAGLVICGKCGRKMVRRPYTREQAPSLMCTCNACDNVSSELSLVERRLIAALDEWAKNYKIQSKSKLSSQNVETEKALIKKVEKETAQYTQQLNKLYDLLERGIYSDEVFLERQKTINNRLKELEEQKIKAEEAIESKSQFGILINDYLPKVINVVNLYYTLNSPAQKNKLLKSVIDSVIYIRTVGGRWYDNKDNFSLKIVPQLPVNHPDILTLN